MPAGAPSAYVSIWYDQSGNGLNLSQTGAITRQPQIVNAGNIIRLNGSATWPGIQGTSASQTNLTATFTTAYTGNSLSINSVLQSDISSTSNLRLWSVGNTALTSADYNNVSFANINQRSGNQFVFERSGVSPSTAFTVGAPLILSGRFNGTNRQLFNNGTGSATQADANSFNFNAIRLLQSINPSFEATEALTGKMAEFSQFSSALSTTRRTLIETNQSAFYSITTSNSIYTPPTPSSYIYYVNGIGRELDTDSVAATRQSSGMGFSCGITATDFLKDNGDYLTCGINCPITPTISTANLPATVMQRWLNDWYVNKTDISANNGLITVYFDFSDYGVGNSPGVVAANYVLLYRNTSAGTFSIVPGTTPSVLGDQVRFALNASNIITNYYYTIGTLNASSSPLPIELLSFSGNCKGNTTTLKWSTANETNNNFFTIERSYDGINFSIIGTMHGGGNSLQTLNYSFIDPTSIEATNYYRIKQTDFNGQFKYSQIIAVNCFSEPRDIKIYPNPLVNELTIEIRGNTESLDFEIISSTGAVIYYGNVYKKTTIETSNFLPGIYLIKFKNGNALELNKIIKQ